MNDRSGEVRNETPAFELPPEPVEGWEKTLEKAKELDVGYDQAVKQVKDPKISQITLPADDLPQTIVTDDTSASIGPINSSDDAAAPPDSAIEKHWVERAKNVLSMHRDSPYKQKAELSKVKAEYLKTKFNKVLKVEEAG